MYSFTPTSDGQWPQINITVGDVIMKWHPPTAWEDKDLRPLALKKVSGIKFGSTWVIQVTPENISFYIETKRGGDCLITLPRTKERDASYMQALNDWGQWAASS